MKGNYSSWNTMGAVITIFCFCFLASCDTDRSGNSNKSTSPLAFKRFSNLSLNPGTGELKIPLDATVINVGGEVIEDREEGNWIQCNFPLGIRFQGDKDWYIAIRGINGKPFFADTEGTKSVWAFSQSYEVIDRNYKVIFRFLVEQGSSIEAIKPPYPTTARLMGTSTKNAFSAQAFVRLQELSMNPLTGEMSSGSSLVKEFVSASSGRVKERSDGGQGEEFYFPVGFIFQDDSEWYIAVRGVNGNPFIKGTSKQTLWGTIQAYEIINQNDEVIFRFDPAFEESDAISALVKDLNNEDHEVSYPAAHELGEIGPEAIPALIEALENEKSDVSMIAIALGEIGLEALPALIKAQQDENPNVRLGASLALARLGPDASEAVPALIRALKDEYPILRYYAIDALNRIGPKAKAAVPALIEALQDKSEINVPGGLIGIGAIPGYDAQGHLVRRSAAYALGAIGPEAREAVPALIEALEDWEDSGDYGSAMTALSEIGPEAIPELIEALEEKKVDFSKITGILGNIGPEAIPALVKLLSHQDKSIRFHVALALQNIGEEAIPVLIKALKDKDANVRASAAIALGSPKAKAAIPALLKALRDEDKEVRFQASLALSDIGEEAIPALVKELGDEDARVRNLSAQVLGNFIGEEAIPALVKAVGTQGNENAMFRASACTALGYMGPKAKTAIPSLTKALEDPNSYTRRCAADALEDIQQ